jgi:hypothetical protein
VRIFQIIIILSTLLSGCVANGYKQYYTPNFDVTNAPPDLQIVPLGQNETPQVFMSNDLNRDANIARSKGWVAVGYSSFNGAMAQNGAVINQAKSIGASMALVSAKYTGTRTITTPLFLPNNQTTIYNGSSNGYINGNAGGTNYNGNYSGTSTGTATTYGTTIVPITTQQDRHDQAAVFFVKSLKKYRIGIQMIDLTPELRSKYERNTGVIISSVMEDSPAFVANVLPGDVLTAIAGSSVINPRGAIEQMKLCAPAGGDCILDIIRNGTEKNISLKLPPVTSN